MTDRETLIEEAGKAIREVRTVTSRGEDGYLSVGSADDETLARAALAVFEKAHTPTDDEREALRESIVLGLGGLVLSYVPSHILDRAVDRVLAAGFRSAQRIGCNICGKALPDGEPHLCSEPQGEPSDAQGIIARALMDSARMDSFNAWSLASDLVTALRAAGGVR